MDTENVSCDICGLDDTLIWGRKDRFNLVKCKRCGLVYVNPRLTLEEIRKRYSEDYFYKGAYADDPQRRQMYEIEIETQIKKVIGTKGRFLDVGCACGAFLNLLPDTFEKYGIEFSEAAADYGRKNFGLNIEAGKISDSKYPDKYFDIIHFRGVVEHLQSPTKDLLNVSRLLKDDGWLIISTTPNAESPAAKLYRGAYRLVWPSEHLYYFSPKTISRLFKKTGFEAKKVYYPYLNTPYANLGRDITAFLFNKLLGRASPPFFYSVMTYYAKKARTL